MSVVGGLLVALIIAVVISRGNAAALADRGYWRLARLMLLFTPDSLHRELAVLQCDLIEGVTENRAERAQRLIAAMISATPMQQLFLANTLCNVLINAGLYRESLGIRRLVRGVMRARPTDEAGGLVIVNVAEALYNLGRWRAAERICRTALASTALTHLALDGMRVQLAWILARTERGDEATRWLALTGEEKFPAMYRSEVHFTHAAASLALGDGVKALAALERGEQLAVRISSRRNAEFLRGEILMASGQLVGAAAAFQRGAASRYRGQGGPSLRRWADCLDRLGRVTEAAEARALVVERDPQSQSARGGISGSSRMGEVLQVGATAAAVSLPGALQRLNVAIWSCAAIGLLVMSVGVFLWVSSLIDQGFAWPTTSAISLGAVICGVFAFAIASAIRRGAAWSSPPFNCVVLLTVIASTGLMNGLRLHSPMMIAGAVLIGCFAVACLVSAAWAHVLNKPART